MLLDKVLYDLPAEELKNIPQMPGSLDEALDAIDKWIEYKRTNEVDALRLRPHPYEFFLYYDI